MKKTKRPRRTSTGRNGADGTNSGTAAAVSAPAGVNDVGRSFADSVYGAFTDAASAADTVIGDDVSHG